MGNAAQGIMAALSQELRQIGERSSGLVVHLNSRGEYPTTGTIWDEGFVVVADHSLDREEELLVTFADGSERSAEVAGRDPSTDLALIKVETQSGGFEHSVESGALQAGILAAALGRNSERGLNISLAVVNAVGGEWKTPAGGRVDHHLRLDVPVRPGFSGGPLVGPDGALIGINSSRLAHHWPVTLPVDTVARVVKELKERGHIRQGYLGIASFPIALSEPLSNLLGSRAAGGLIIVETEAESTSAKAGVLQGDILVAIDGSPLESPEELQSRLTPETVGTTVTLRLVRGGQIVEVPVQVGERPLRRRDASRRHPSRHHGPGAHRRGGR